MNKVILGVVLLIGLVCSFDRFEQFRQIDADEFGKTLLDTLQIQMQSGEPIQRFGEIMRDLESGVEAEQKEDDKKNQQYQNQCSSDADDLESQNALIARRVVEIQSVLDELIPLQQKKQSKLIPLSNLFYLDVQGSKNMWKEELEKKVNELVAQRKNENGDFEQRMKEHDYAAYVIETVRRMFSDNAAQPSFLQEKSSSDDVSVETMKAVHEQLVHASEEAKKFRIKKSYSQTFKVLAQIAASMTQQQLGQRSLVQRILGLCDLLLHNIEQSRILETRAETKRVNNFNQEKSLFDKDLNKINTELGRLQAEVLQLQDRITNSNRDMTDTTQRKEQKQKQVDDRSSECKEKAYNYEQARKIRQFKNDKRQLISQIIGIFTANQRDFQAYVKVRAGAGDYEGENFRVLGGPQQ